MHSSAAASSMAPEVVVMWPPMIARTLSLDTARTPKPPGARVPASAGVPEPSETRTQSGVSPFTERSSSDRVVSRPDEVTSIWIAPVRRDISWGPVLFITDRTLTRI